MSNKPTKSTFVPFLLKGFADKYDIEDLLSNLMVATLDNVASAWEFMNGGGEFTNVEVAADDAEAAIVLATHLSAGNAVVFEDQDAMTIYFCQIYQGAFVAVYHPMSPAFNRFAVLCPDPEVVAGLNIVDGFTDDIAIIAKIFDLPLPKPKTEEKPQATTSFATGATKRKWFGAGAKKPKKEAKVDPVPPVEPVQPVPETPQAAAAPTPTPEQPVADHTTKVGQALHEAFAKQQAEQEAANSTIGTR